MTVGSRQEMKGFDLFHRTTCRTLRRRYAISYRDIHAAMPTPRVPVANLKMWESGRSGTVDEDWRWRVYQGMQICIITKCQRTIESIEDTRKREASEGHRAPVDPRVAASFLMGGNGR